MQTQQSCQVQESVLYLTTTFEVETCYRNLLCYVKCSTSLLIFEAVAMSLYHHCICILMGTLYLPMYIHVHAAAIPAYRMLVCAISGKQQHCTVLYDFGSQIGGQTSPHDGMCHLAPNPRFVRDSFEVFLQGRPSDHFPSLEQVRLCTCVHAHTTHCNYQELLIADDLLTYIIQWTP